MAGLFGEGGRGYELDSRVAIQFADVGQVARILADCDFDHGVRDRRQYRRLLYRQ